MCYKIKSYAESYAGYNIEEKTKKAQQMLGFLSSGNRTRTCDLRVMSPTSCLLLYPAMFRVQIYVVF